MHEFAEDCCGDTSDATGVCVVVVDGDCGQPKAEPCTCDEHEEV